MEPIGNFLSGERLKVASLQDHIIDVIYSRIEPTALLYGGTAIWRCYRGERFSEDIDIYMQRKSIEKLIVFLPRAGLRLMWRDNELPGYIRIRSEETSVLLEAKEGYGENVIGEYSRIDGSKITISVLSPFELLKRKIEAYDGRRYIRDLYDIFILTRFLEREDYLVQGLLSSFLSKMNEPVDESVLESLIYAGDREFDYSGIVNYLERWLNEI